MRGGKRKGSGRKPIYGNEYKKTCVVRIPAALKDEIVELVKTRLNENVTQSKIASKKDLKQVKEILESALKLPANKGGAIKTEIRKALKLLNY